MTGLQASVASRVISMPASACETGHPLFAACARRSKSSGSSPGTTAFTLRRLPVMPVPGLNVTDAVVSIDSGGVPFSARAAESAMLKHDACAAAMSSSGVVTDVEPSLRAFQFTGKVPRPDDTNVVSPEPSNRPPFHTVVASLVTVMWASSLAGRPRAGRLASAYGVGLPHRDGLTPDAAPRGLSTADAASGRRRAGAADDAGAL